MWKSEAGDREAEQEEQMVKLIDRRYKNACCHRVEEWLIDTDAEVLELPKAPPGSFAISAETGKIFYVKVNGEWT